MFCSMPDIELDPDRFREVPGKPLARRGTLWFIMAGALGRSDDLTNWDSRGGANQIQR
jgi:hypothetical protein